MSTKGAADARLDDDHAARRRATDPERRRLHNLFIGDDDPTTTTFAAHAPEIAELLLEGVGDSGNPLSLGNCEKVPISKPAGGSAAPDVLGASSAADVSPAHLAELLGEQRGDEMEAIRASLGRSRERQAVTVALVEAGEVAHARRFAECLEKSAQLECPTMAGGCGSDDNFVPMTCDSRLCPVCGARRQGRVASQYGPIVASWVHPTMIGAGLDRRVDPDATALERAIDALRGAFGRLRRRVVPPEGPGWSWRSSTCADHTSPRRECSGCTVGWKRTLLAVGAHDLARHLQKRYVDQGRGIPFREVVPRGFYAVDVKQQDDGRLNVHLHVLADCPWLPQPALSHLWDELLAAPVVDIRRVDGRGHQDAAEAALEVAGYAAKAPQYDSAEAKVEYLKAVKGSKLVQPFGDLHGNVDFVEGRLCCSDCGQAPRWWNYLDIVRGTYDTMMPDWEESGDRPPP